MSEFNDQKGFVRKNAIDGYGYYRNQDSLDDIAQKDLKSMSIDDIDNMDMNDSLGFGDLPTPVSDSSLLSSGDISSKNAGGMLKNWRVGDRYKLVRVIGRGSYGEVAEAIDTQRNFQKVAIKRIQYIFDSTLDAKRVLREMYILRHMKHPNIIKLLDVIAPNFTPTNPLLPPPSRETGTPSKRSRHIENEVDTSLDDLYLVFEYVDTDLNRLLSSAQYLSPAHIQTFLYQLLVGLKYLHSANVIHRDIKPANILLYEDCTLKICDFGLSRVLNAPPPPLALMAEISNSSNASSDLTTLDVSTNSTRTSDSSVSTPVPLPVPVTRQMTHHVVTRWYRAPELILLRQYTCGVDVWSAGCVLAELLGMQAESVRDFQDRAPLFPGSSCRTLSTDGLQKPENFLSKRSQNYNFNSSAFDPSDQLCIILNIIGSPAEEDIAAIGDPETEEYLRSLPYYRRKNLSKRYAGASPDAIDLLVRLLHFNPDKRLTVDEALAHPYLRGIRDSQLEISAENLLTMEIERMPFLVRDDIRENMKHEILQYFPGKSNNEHNTI